MSLRDLNLAPVPCRWCGGTGVNNTLHIRHPGGACRVCRGAGSLLVYRPPQPCPRCGGTGVEGAADRFHGCAPCRSCAGTGWQFYLLRFDGDVSPQEP